MRARVSNVPRGASPATNDSSSAIRPLDISFSCGPAVTTFASASTPSTYNGSPPPAPPRPRRYPLGHERSVVAAGDEADVGGVRLVGVRQAVPPRGLADLRLAVLAHREQRAAQLPLPQRVHHIRLVLRSAD